jgi:hypothetical protein
VLSSVAMYTKDPKKCPGPSVVSVAFRMSARICSHCT